LLVAVSCRGGTAVRSSNPGGKLREASPVDVQAIPVIKGGHHFPDPARHSSPAELHKSEGIHCRSILTEKWGQSSAGRR